jgi:hypothetical protein
MYGIRKNIIKKANKPFTLDPALNNLKDFASVTSAKEYNWNIIATELE